MKTKLLLSLVLFLNFCLLSSQVPQGFNYQAIARDPSTGDAIANATIDVKLGILSDTLTPVIVREELFSSVKTDRFGVFTLVIGTGTYQTGSVTNFSDIDWTAKQLYLRVQIKLHTDVNWKYMGSAKLWSVPYSMVAGNLEGTVPLLSVKGNTTAMDSALFVVRNNTGQIVFAVYNEGVRIYVDDGVAKGATKGGFAIGSFDKSKGTTQPLFVVDPDSIRAYLDNNPTKAVKGGFAIGGFDKSKSANQNFLSVSKDSIRMYIDDNLLTKSRKGGFAIGSFDKSKGGNVNYLNVSTDSSGIINPSQNRILWYPTKNAFLTGKILIEKPDSVGENSFASGYESKAIGQYSQALGYQAIARGIYSTSIGYQSVANLDNSFAFGQWAQAKNTESYAFGRGAIAEGYRSFAFGSAGVDSSGQKTGVAYAKGDYSFAIGQGSQALATGTFSIGLADTAKKDFSIAIGYKSSSAGFNALALGNKTRSLGVSSTAIGEKTTASGVSSSAFGSSTIASGNYTTAAGISSVASGVWSTAIGSNCLASGTASVAIGYSVIASGGNSIAMGELSFASGDASIALGLGSYAIGVGSVAIGSADTAKGKLSSSLGFAATSFGWISTAFGYFTRSKPYASFVIGQYNDTTCSSDGDRYWRSNDPLFICGNGSSGNCSNAFTILKNGNTAIGHATPTEMLDVKGNARFRSVSSGTFAYNLNLTSDGTLTTSTSDIRMKENINQITNALEKVDELRGVTFTWKNDSLKTQQIGMIAQEVEKVLPEVVFTNPVDGLKGINYSQTSALLVEAIKEQQKQIEGQQQQIKSVKQENQQLRTELDELKTLVNTLVVNQTGQGNK